MKFSQDLEQCVISVLMSGEMGHEEINEQDFSKVGQIVIKAINFLNTTAKPPFKPKEVSVAAVELFGADQSELSPFLKAVVGIKAGKGTQSLVEAVRNKMVALGTIKLLSDQLAEGTFNFESASRGLQVVASSTPLSTLASLQGETITTSLSGYNLGEGFPYLQEATGGLFGLWTIGGEPAIGKSTLALQLAIQISNENQVPVLYYDFENGPQVVLYRLGRVFKSPREIRRQTHRIFLREHIRTLQADLKAVNEKVLIVVDSFQSIPTKALSRRQDLDGWLGRFEALKKEGHSILLVSEINRSMYGKASNKGFKETGELEYKSDLAIDMIGNPDTPEIHIVKNRHGNKKGLICQLLRKNELWFEEISDGGTTDEL